MLFCLWDYGTMPHAKLLLHWSVNVISEFFTRVKFLGNFAYAKFCENQTLTNWRYHSVDY